MQQQVNTSQAQEQPAHPQAAKESVINMLETLLQLSKERLNVITQKKRALTQTTAPASAPKGFEQISYPGMLPPFSSLAAQKMPGCES